MKKITPVLSLLGLFITLSSCATAPPAHPQALWLHGGQIWTGDPTAPSAQAVLVADGHVVAIGSDAVVAAAARDQDARSIDLHGRVVVPGFIDAHVHILSGGLGLERLDLNPAHSKEETLSLVRAYAQAHPDYPWILGRGWSYELWKPGFPSREELDRAVPDRPVYLRSYDGHSSWANSRAIELAGLDEKTPDPKEGKIIRAAGTKRPQGTFLEEAMELVSIKIPKPTTAERKAAILRALQHAAELGVTGLCEVGDTLEDFSIYASLDRDGLLRNRVIFGPHFDEGIDTYAQFRKDFLAARPAHSLLWPGPLKGFVDGVVESNTAAMLAPYSDGSGPGTPPHLSHAKILEQVRAADRLGIDVAYHAVGDASVHSVLDAVEEVERTEKPRERRPRIEHIEIVAKSDIPRFARLGVIASMMPAHADPGDEPNGGVWSQKVGKERLHRAFAFNSLNQAKARLAFGSDWPVASVAPLPAIAIAVTRQGDNGLPKKGWIPEQRISMDTALTGFTAGSAYAVRLDHEVGILKPQMDGDLVVLSQDADLKKPASLFKANVDLTVVAGQVIFERK